MIFTILVILTLFLFFSFLCFDKDICAPSFLLTVGFWGATVWCFFYQDHWNGFSDVRLMILIIGAVGSFIISSCIVHVFWGRKKKKRIAIQLKPIKLDKSQYIVLLMGEMVVAIYTLYVVYKNVDSLNPIIAIGQYYYANKYRRLSYDPGLLSAFQYFNIALVFVIAYAMITNYLCKQKNTIYEYLVIAGGIVISLLQGTRNTLFLFVISIAIMFLTLKKIQNGGRANITLKSFSKLILGSLALIFLFRVTLVVTGRASDEFTFTEMLSTYVGASIKNLELFIQENHSRSTVWGGQTLLQTYSKLYNETENPKFLVTSLYTYRWIGKTGLGNIYTMLMPLYVDFGTMGTCIVMAIIGGVSQFQYECIYRIKNSKDLMRKIIFYSYVGFSISFAFFSNKYFEMVVSMAFIYTIIGYVMLKVLIFDVKIKDGRIVIKLKRRN